MHDQTYLNLIQIHVQIVTNSPDNSDKNVLFKGANDSSATLDEGKHIVFVLSACVYVWVNILRVDLVAYFKNILPIFELMDTFNSFCYDYFIETKTFMNSEINFS